MNTNVLTESASSNHSPFTTATNCNKTRLTNVALWRTSTPPQLRSNFYDIGYRRKKKVIPNMKHFRLKSLNFLCCGHKSSDIDPAASPKHPSDTELVQRSSEALFPPKPRCAFTTIAVTEHDSIAQSPFFTKFPPEIRLQIYKYALFVANDDGYCVVTKEKGIPGPPLLLTCKAIRKEAIDTFYHQKWFLLVLKDWNPAALVLMTRKTKLLVTLLLLHFQTATKAHGAALIHKPSS
jgi:hypothetical protein